jgi:L-2-hydroxyglutarate oxidase
MTIRADYLIIGSGSVGLATGIAILESFPDSKVIIMEKEKQSGGHASGRNSGVLHAGFYYSPDSLKAKFCREGNFEIRKLAREYNVPIRETGKIVVARNEIESERLVELFNRGQQNGVELEIHPESLLQKFEPCARTTEKFLWSPTTAISSPLGIVEALEAKFLSMGGRVLFDQSVKLMEKNGEIIDSTNCFSAQHIINAAGAYSDEIAHSIGIGSEYLMIPFLGVYRATSITRAPIRTLIYPVPHEVNPFLGVHLTLTLNGEVKVGPSAIPVLSREQYSILTGASMRDLSDILKACYYLARGEAHSMTRLISLELPFVFKSRLISEANKLLKIEMSSKNWKKKPPGIRSQLVHAPSGTLLQDYKVINYLNSTHLLNVVSPGWTSAIPFARYVLDQIKQR